MQGPTRGSYGSDTDFGLPAPPGRHELCLVGRAMAPALSSYSYTTIRALRILLSLLRPLRYAMLCATSLGTESSALVQSSTLVCRYRKLNTHTHIYIYISIYMLTPPIMDRCVSWGGGDHIYIYIHIHIHIYIYIHIHTYIYIYAGGASERQRERERVKERDRE